MKFFLLLFFIAACNFCFAQADTLNVKIGNYKFRAIHVDTNYTTTLRITEGNDVVFKGEFEERIEAIEEVDFNNDGNKTILMDVYSGGAHCCNTLYACKIKNDKFVFTDTLYLADAFFEVEDLDRNGKREFITYNMMFAYAFTNFAETRSPFMVFTVMNGRFKDVTKNFPELIRNQIREWEYDLQVFLDSNYQCPEEGEETFNTDAGSVKTILAGITANYFTLGEAYRGYDLIERTYRCADKDKFVQTLKEDYKLK